MFDNLEEDVTLICKKCGAEIKMYQETIEADGICEKNFLCTDCDDENFFKEMQKGYEKISQKKIEQSKKFKKDPSVPKVICISCSHQCGTNELDHPCHEDEYVFLCDNKKCKYRNEFFINKVYYKNLIKIDHYVIFTNSGLILHPTLPDEHLSEKEYKKELKNPTYLIKSDGEEIRKTTHNELFPKRGKE